MSEIEPGSRGGSCVPHSDLRHLTSATPGLSQILRTGALSSNYVTRPDCNAETVQHTSSAKQAPRIDTDELLRVKAFAELTAQNGAQFRKTVTAALNGRISVEIDLAGTTFMDAAGLGALIALANCTKRHNGVIRLLSPRPAVRRLFAIVRADQMFDIVDPKKVDKV